MNGTVFWFFRPRQASPQIIVIKGPEEPKILWKSPQKRLYLNPLFGYNKKVKMDARFSDSPPLINLFFSMR
jgi:hypothetical protein